MNDVKLNDNKTMNKPSRLRIALIEIGLLYLSLLIAVAISVVVLLS